MAHVPLRMAQPSLVPPHQQRPPMMVSMTQPPPVSMQGLVSMAPMMGPGGGMAVMTQAMNHPDSGHEHHPTMNGPYHHHHHHHPHHPPHGAGPRPHAPSQAHQSVHPPPHPSGLPQPPHSAPPHSQYHPHPGGPHHAPHSHHNGLHSVHHSAPPHSHSGAHPQPHISNHSSSNSSSSHNTHGHPQPHLQSGPSHLSQPSHSMPHHSPHQMTGLAAGSLSSSHHNQHQQHHSQHSHHHQTVHQQMPHSQMSQQPPPPPHPTQQQHLHHHPSNQHQVQGQSQQQHSGEGSSSLVMKGTPQDSSSTMNMLKNLSSTTSSTVVGSSASINGLSGNRGSSGTNISSNENSSESTSVAVSTREKTPMCLINELARYNKISHQYCLTDEKGPAHKKIFTVTLKLGENGEEYSASGPSIKKAQHLAAALSLEKTKYSHPPPKTHRQNKQTKLTPTVELNALAMKRGEAAVYTFMELPRHYNTYGVSHFRDVYNHKLYGRSTMYPMFFVNLRVGNRDFGGEGATAQQAKHNAASKALKVLKALPLPENTSGSVATSGSSSSSSSSSGGQNAAPTASGTNAPTTNNPGDRGDISELGPNADLKSPISLVHEIALKRNLTVSFEVVRESGPPHMRTFITACIVGEIRSQGEGTGKKVSKKRAAELMLEELRKLPPVTSSALTRAKRKPSTKKKSRNLIKVGQQEQKAAPDYGQGINPISRLIQIQQAKKEKEPVYSLMAERGVPRRREFFVQVAVGVHTAQGSGPNKKLAKRSAAENMLQLLGYSRPQPQPTKPALKMDGGSHSDSDKTRKQVTFLEETDSRSHNDNTQSSSSSIQSQQIPPGSGRQLVPGLIMMPDGSALHGYQQMQHHSGMNNVNNNSMNQMVNMQATAAIAKELLESGSSPTAKALSKNQTSVTQSTTQSHSATNHQIGLVSQKSMNHQSGIQGNSAQSSMPSSLVNHPSMMQGGSAPGQQHSNHQPSGQQQQQASQQQQQSHQHQTQRQQRHQGASHLGISSNTSNKMNSKSNNSSSLNGTVNSSNTNSPNSTSKNSNQGGGGLNVSDKNATTGQVVRPKDQLMYLANILDLQVQFTDIPKANKSQYLSLVSLSTSPPQVYHGSGPTIDASQDQACLTALKGLAEIGLEMT